MRGLHGRYNLKINKFKDILFTKDLGVFNPQAVIPARVFIQCYLIGIET